MKILLVSDQYFSANNGMTISARRFAQVLTSHGNEVRIVSTGKPEDSPYIMPKRYIPIFDKLVTSQGMTFAKTNKKILIEALEWADIVHFLTPFSLSHNGIKMARELGVPYTAAFHVQPENITSSIYLSSLDDINNFIYKIFRKNIYKYCTHIHCPSNFIANELQKNNYYGQLHVISNGIDPDFKYRKIPKKPEYEDKFLILTIGRLSIEKRQDVLINAVKKSKYNNKIQLLIAGQGPRKEKLLKLAKGLKNPVSIKFYEHDDLLDIIAMSDLYVHPAQVEIEAMSCMEAFAGGLVPIIANSKKSATPQFALDERSLFESGNPDELAKRIDYWIEHEEERKKMEYKYSESAEKYKLEECVKKAEEMFALAIEDTERAYEEGRYANKKHKNKGKIKKAK
ncbi:MAG: glycosyltransferase [Oscillospiraceae bacterium]